MGYFYLKETFPPLLLKRKAARMREEEGLEKDSKKITTSFELVGEKKDLKHIFTHGLARPFIMLAQERIIQLLAVYMAVIVSILRSFIRL